jgi:hypothetical protein
MAAVGVGDVRRSKSNPHVAFTVVAVEGRKVTVRSHRAGCVSDISMSRLCALTRLESRISDLHGVAEQTQCATWEQK